MKKILPPLVRVNSRVRVEQFRAIRLEAKKLKVGEGEMLRIILDDYFKKYV
jgi:hypothetical protein